MRPFLLSRLVLTALTRQTRTLPMEIHTARASGAQSGDGDLYFQLFCY